MRKNQFAENRKKILEHFIDSDFLKPLTKDDLPLTIEKDKNKKYVDKLVYLNIENIPVSDANRPISYILNAEIIGKVFSCPPGVKTVEKIIFLLTNKCVYTIAIEMKSAISPPLIKEIKEKIEDSVNRSSLFLTHYLLDVEDVHGKERRFISIVFYNSDSLTHEIKEIPGLQNQDLVKIFQGKYSSFFIEEPIGQKHKCEVIFKKNPSPGKTFNFDFSELFEQFPDFENAIFDDRTLP